MLVSSICRRCLASALVSLWISSSASAAAQAADPANGAAEEARGAVVLALRGDPLDGERLRTLLEAELSSEVVLEHAPRPHVTAGVLTFAYRREAGELAVTWDSGGQAVTRVVAAPADPATLVRDAALLAGNLTRRQIEDLLPAPAPAAAAPVAPVAAPSPELDPAAAQPAHAETQPLLADGQRCARERVPDRDR